MDKLELRFNSASLTTDDDSKDLKVEGYVNLTEQPSEILSTQSGHRFIEKIGKGAFDSALKRANEIDFLVEHDRKRILSSTRNNSLKLVEDDKGLFMSATISPTTWGQDYYTLVKDGIIKNFSFGFRALRDDWDERSDGVLERTVHDLELFEVSLVKNPAYTQSFVEARDSEFFTVDEVYMRGERMSEEKRTVEEEVEETAEPTEEEKEQITKYEQILKEFEELKHLILAKNEEDEEEIDEEEESEEESEEKEDEEERALPEDVEKDEEEKDEESLKSTILGLEMKIEKLTDMFTEFANDKLREDNEEEKEEDKEKDQKQKEEKEEKKEEQEEPANLKKLQDTLAGLQEFSE